MLGFRDQRERTTATRAEKPQLLADPAAKSSYGEADAKALAKQLVHHLGLDPKYLKPAYEDVAYYLWKEGNLPENVDVVDNRINDPIERNRIRKVFDQEVNSLRGYALPLAWDEKGDKWTSGKWTFRRGKLFLIPGDSAMGYRLPLDSLLWEPIFPKKLIFPVEMPEIY